MNKRVQLTASFSLVEVTLALGVATFCLVTLLGLLPIGVRTNQNASSQTAAASLLSSVIADLRATPPTHAISTQYGISWGTEKSLYFDREGRSVVLTDPNATPRYRVTIMFPDSPPGDFAPTFVRLKVSWPAAADPETAIGFAETFIAIDRH